MASYVLWRHGDPPEQRTTPDPLVSHEMYRRVVREHSR